MKSENVFDKLYSKQRLEAILDTIPSAILILESPDGLISFNNKRATELYGFNAVGLNLQTYADRLRQERNDGTPYRFDDLPASRSLQQGQEVRNEELKLVRSNGDSFPVLLSSAPLFDSEGKIGAAVVVFEDIAERVNTRENLKRQANLIDLSPDGIFVKKLDGTITFWSKGAETIYGWTKQEAMGQKSDNLLGTKFSEPIDNIFERLTKTCYWSGELEHRTKSNRRVIVQSYWLAKAENGKISEIFESNVDITDQKRLQVELQRSVSKLREYADNMEALAQERLEKLKNAEKLATIGEITGMVSHDIRSPLQAITNELYLLRSEVESNQLYSGEKEIRKSLEALEKEVGYIEKIVTDLRDFSRPLKPELIKVDLCLALSEIIRSMQLPDIIQLELTCDRQRVESRLDLGFFKRIVTNLVSNAVQAMPNGGKLSVRAFSSQGKAFITVEDTGVGMSKEVQDKLFTPLFTTKAKGQGFGLIVIKRMTEALGGSVTFESQLGKGTKFIVELPKYAIS